MPTTNTFTASPVLATAAVASQTPAQPRNPDFVPGRTYGCIDNTTKNGKKSKSFTVGQYYLCVKNYDQVYLVSNSGAIVEVGHFGSRFVEFPQNQS